MRVGISEARAAIDHAVKWFVPARPDADARRQGKRLDADARRQAKRLETAAARYLRTLAASEFFWSYMQFKAEESASRDEGLLGLKRPPIKYFGRRLPLWEPWLPGPATWLPEYDTWLPDHYDAVLSAELVQKAAEATVEALKKGTRKPNELRRALGRSLAVIYVGLTGASQAFRAPRPGRSLANSLGSRFCRRPTPSIRS